MAKRSRKDGGKSFPEMADKWPSLHKTPLSRSVLTEALRASPFQPRRKEIELHLQCTEGFPIKVSFAVCSLLPSHSVFTNITRAGVQSQKILKELPYLLPEISFRRQ